MRRPTSLLLMVLLVAAINGRAASSEAALSQQRRASKPDRGAAPLVPRTVPLRDVSGRGLLVRTWINGTGPFNFAIDTGSGATLISSQVAAEARVARSSERPTTISGITGRPTTAYPAVLQTLAAGDMENYFPARGEILIATGLPSDLDGVIDPTEALAPLGYTIDIPRKVLTAFDPQVAGIRADRFSGEGAVVSWLREGHGRRPFVMLSNGDRALLDTGSSLGLAVRDTQTGSRAVYAARDVGGGQISTRRVTTSNISIGSLALQRIPTDLVSGAESDAPTLLGLAALRPFRLSFDPLHRLIEISTSVEPRRN